MWIAWITNDGTEPDAIRGTLDRKGAQFIWRLDHGCEDVHVFAGETARDALVRTFPGDEGYEVEVLFQAEQGRCPSMRHAHSGHACGVQLPE